MSERLEMCDSPGSLAGVGTEVRPVKPEAQSQVNDVAAKNKQCETRLAERSDSESLKVRQPTLCAS